MRTLITIFFLLFSLFASAQQIKLKFKPEGKIIQFEFENLTAVTDSSALLEIYNENGGNSRYQTQVQKLIRQKIIESATDTILFSGKVIPFNESDVNDNQTGWKIEWALIELAKANKLMILDNDGNLIKALIIKKVSTNKGNYVYKAYMNKATKEVLLKEVIYRSISEPEF